MSYEVGKPYNPWLLYGGLTIPGWLLVRSELSLGAKLLAAFILEEQTVDEARDEGWVPILVGVADPVGRLVAEYHGDEEEVCRWWDELGSSGFLEMSADGKDRFYFDPPEEWEDPTFEVSEDGEPVYTEHGSGAAWMGNETLTVSDSDEEEDDE